MKNISVIRAEGGQVIDLPIVPGMTAREVLNQAGLDPTYTLSPGQGHDVFDDNDVIYGRVPNTAKLWASTPAEVGSQGPPQAPRVAALIFDGLRAFQRVMEDLAEAPARTGVPTPHPLHPINRVAAPVPATRARGGASARKDSPNQAKGAAVPYWVERGWKRDGWGYSGSFATRHGKWAGRADASPAGRIDLFIHRPPPQLARHGNWICFHARLGGWYFVHCHDLMDLSAGILRVEQILNEAHAL